jgi:hypothetical protein
MQDGPLQIPITDAALTASLRRPEALHVHCKPHGAVPPSTTSARAATSATGDGHPLGVAG